MQLQNKNILLISPEPWSYLFVSKHHYAIHLGKKGNKVFFLNPPSQTTAIVTTNYENVYSINYKGFPKGLRFYPSFFQKFFIRKKFEELQKQCGATFDIVWSFDNSVFFDFSALPEKVFTISHIVDSTQDFQFEKACSTANLCLSVTSYINKRQKQFSKNSFFINHGYSLVINKILVSNNVLVEMKSNRVSAGYAGNLSIPYIDWGLLVKTIEQNPNVDFYFAGSNPEILQIKSSNYKNVFYVGVLNSEHLQRFYSQVDILILSYRHNDFPEQLSNPHKMMEYLASGKMIVATWTEEYTELHQRKLIMMNRTEEEYVNAFQKVIRNLDGYNNEARQQQRKDFALENTYEKQVNKIEQILIKLNE